LINGTDFICYGPEFENLALLVKSYSDTFSWKFSENFEVASDTVTSQRMRSLLIAVIGFLLPYLLIGDNQIATIMRLILGEE